MQEFIKRSTAPIYHQIEGTFNFAGFYPALELLTSEPHLAAFAYPSAMQHSCLDKQTCSDK